MSHTRHPERSSLPSGRSWAAVSLLAWTAFLAAVLALLHNFGGPLAPPPLAHPTGWGGWIDGREPAEAAVAVMRLVVLGLAWYLLAVTVAGTVARLAGAHLLVRAVDAVTVPLVRRLVGPALGVSVATAASFTGAASAATTGHTAQPAAAETVYHPPPAPGADAPPTMQRLPDPPPDPADSFRTTAPPAPPPAGADGTTRVTTPPPPPVGPAPVAEGTTTPPPAGRSAPPGPADAGTANVAPGTTPPAPVPAPPRADAPAPPPAAPSATTWTVSPGDHFWSVAERVLAQAWGRAASDGEVDPYWRSLVEANRSVLKDPANPDLLFPGQVIRVIPPPAAPAP